MSLWSTFYFGDAKRIKILLNENRIDLLENDSEVESLDFSGGVLAPFLFPDDFDILLELMCSSGESAFSKFNQAYSDQIWGEPDDEQNAENQAFLLKHEFVESIARVSDDTLRIFSARWNAKNQKDKEESSVAAKRYLRDEQFRYALGFWTFPVAVTVGVFSADHGSLAWYWKLGGPVIATVCAFLIKAKIRRSFTREKHGNCEAQIIEWVHPLQELRQACLQACKNHKDAIYLWSL